MRGEAVTIAGQDLDHALRLAMAERLPGLRGAHPQPGLHVPAAEGAPGLPRGLGNGRQVKGKSRVGLAVRRMTATRLV